MKEIKPSDAARISGGAPSTIPNPESAGLDPMPVSRAQPLPPEFSPEPVPVPPTPSSKPPAG
jgi:hypothetical protein